jgi:glycosyltransferase involved in cell wall biosynthesis
VEKKSKLKQLAKRIMRKFNIEVRKLSPNDEINKIISLSPKGICNGNVLLSYTLNPFLREEDEDFTNLHTCDWECFQMAKTFLDLGYSVDVIHYQNKKFFPRKDYCFFIDVHTNLERIGPLLNDNCLKIFHIVWAHWLFHNTAAYTRHLELKQRRNITIKPNTQLMPNLAIENADCCTILGNEFTKSTFSYARKPIFDIPVSTCDLYSWAEEKNYEICRNNFLWFGGHGLVHKGLDLVLEAFAEMPDYKLYVCGPIENEKDFERAYWRELYESRNIHSIGWVDVHSHEFTDITAKCVALIYPSCSEGGGGSVIQCMHAGLIPIVSYESSVDIGDFGVILESCSIKEIKRSIRMISNLPTKDLKVMSKRAWDFARANHTRERFAKEYRRIVKKITAIHHEKKKSYRSEIS